MIITLQTLIFFRESIVTAMDRLLRPYYPHFLTFNMLGNVGDDDESEDQVFAEFHDHKGVVFYPPVYAQRYAAVSDCLNDDQWRGKLEKVVDLGFHDLSFIKYLKEIPGVKFILGVDIDNVPLSCSSDLLGGDEYSLKRDNPVKVTLYQGNAADPDYRLIGCDAVIAIEMIEHMLPHDLERLVHTVFGFIKPWIAVFTTPNSDFNELFKALESNGLRRLDHFFEWSREQFHDWCSNIVARYPQYTVNCRGIGPGPPGTKHLGCCSQLALFTSKDYHKQQDLDLNSLAIVAKNARQSNDLSELIGDLDNPGCSETDIGPPNEVASYTDVEFPDKYSSMSIIPASTISMESMEYRDETSQCNLDIEIGRNFLMFEDDSCCDVIVPRRKIKNRVYDIEDVTSRLNCTTLQVKKFSKTTQNMMTKNKIDALVHTQEIVDEISHITKMLNFRKETVDRGLEKGDWCNINWGENAPYWNQYYKVIKEFSHPFEKKSEESLILDLISDEVNRLIDMQNDEDFSVDVNKLEIPLDRLMDIVQHITDDVDRVKDLLEWNGYEIVDNMVIHSRLVVENASVSQDNDWPDDTTDFNTTDIHSTTASEANIVLPDFYGRCLRRALDLKLRELRSMLTADEDVSTELDKVVCRLMKLALRTSRGRQAPPPSRWIECKLFDLLSLTVRAIERRNRHFTENCAFKTLDFDYQSQKAKDLALANNKADEFVDELVNKYHHVVQSYDNEKKLENDCSVELFHENDWSVSWNEFVKDQEYFSDDHPNIINVDTPTDSGLDYKILYNEDQTKLQRVQAWVVDDVEVVPYPNHDVRDINSGDTDNSVSNMAHKKSSLKHKVHVAETNKTRRRENYKHYKNKYDDKTNLTCQTPRSNNNFSKKIPIKKCNYNILTKTYKNKTPSTDYKNYMINNKKKYRYKNYQMLQSNMPKPIPESLIRHCNPEKKNQSEIEDKQCSITEVRRNDSPYFIIENVNISATEESLLVDRVMEKTEGTIALCQTIGTDDEDTTEVEQETILKSIINVTNEDNFCHPRKIVQPEPIFLYDINEPSTSKGLCHLSMDVQCGPDVTSNSFPTLSAATSFTKIPKTFITGSKIGDSFMNIGKSTDFGTCTDDCHENCKTMSPRTRSVGITIKDSDPVICESCSMTYCQNKSKENVNYVFTETQLIQSISGRLRIEDSCSEFYKSVRSSRKSPSQFANSSTNTSDINNKSPVTREIIAQWKYSSTKYIRPKLCRGGIHVHSYKDQQESSDVLFQGQWQRCKPKVPAKKNNMYNSGIRKRVCDMPKKIVNSVEKIQEYKLTKFKVEIKQKNQMKLAHIRARHVAMDKMKENNKNLVNNNLIKSVHFSRNVTKVTPKLAISSVTCKNIKSVSATKRPPGIKSTLAMESNLSNPINNKYLPKYLKRNKTKLVTNESLLNQSVGSPKAVIKVSTIKPIERVAPLQKSKTVDIKKQLLRFPDEPRDNINFVVFRNDTNNNKNTTDGELPKGNFKKKDNSGRRTYSPQSQNSSNCSSPNSIATVRGASPNIVSTRRYSMSPNSANVDSESKIILRNKTFIKKTKSGKRTNEKNLNNKENIPESSTKYNINKDSDKLALASFVGANRSVYRAQVTTISGLLQNAPNSLSRHKSLTTIKSGMKYTNTDRKRSVNAPLSKARTSISPIISAHKISSNKTLVLTSETVSVQEVQNALVILEPEQDFENKKDTHYSQSQTDNSIIFTDIKCMIEERLAFIENISDTSVDSETEIFSRENLQKSSLFESSSPESFKTIITNDDLSKLRSEIENAMSTFDSILVDESASDFNSTDVPDVPDTDLLSFKSITTPASETSEYFLADTELNNNEVYVRNESSVQDIFDRKDHLQIKSTAGPLAIQAFSGFSMNVESVGGDRLDPVNFIDSETGSIALQVARQTTSEELFTSGRSSGTYETCHIDEDAMLPYWLFQISQQSVDEEEPEQVIEIPVPLPEHMFDGNGNVIPEVGAGTGAGDGRGMHSDNSQDSSGRGTTTSSSESSPGVESETELVDPSALAMEFEMIREAMDNSDAPPISSSFALTDTSFIASDAEEHNDDMVDDICTSRNERRNPTMPLAISDMDADVSSLDADVLDSSDN